MEQLDAGRLPHMGWNTVHAPQQSRLFDGLDGERFYFVHSFAATQHPADALVTTAEHEGSTFIAAVERVTGTTIRVEMGPRREGDPAILVGSSEKARNVLGWKPRFADIETITAHAWAWHRTKSQ